MLLQLLHDHFDCSLELRVVALPPGSGFEIDFNIRRDAVVFDLPVAVEAVDSRSWRGNVPAVDQFRIAADSDESSPSLLAHQWTEPGLAEVPRQRVATGTGHFVDHHHLGAVDGF